jgi:hypothetical protein
VGALLIKTSLEGAFYCQMIIAKIPGKTMLRLFFDIKAKSCRWLFEQPTFIKS